MKLDVSEKLLVEELWHNSCLKLKKTVCYPDKIQKLTGDASTRRYYRLYSAGESYVACLDKPIPGGKNLSDFLNVHRLLMKNNVSVPHIYDFSLSKGYYLEEDLGDETFLKYLSRLDNLEQEYIWYQKAIDRLIEIQQISLLTKNYKQKYHNKSFTFNCFDYAKLFSEMNFSFHYLADELLQVKISNKDKLKIMQDFSSICEKIASEKMVLSHRDYHSRNIMIKTQEMKIIDFQDARYGIPQYDLVSLLEDAYYKIELSNHLKLKYYYWDCFMKGHSLQESYAQFDYLYHLVGIQRIFKAIGSFCYIYSFRKDDRYLKYIGHCFENIKAIMYDLGEYKQLRKLLLGLYYES